jgi:superfamily II DNA or RNA helicase
MKSSQSKEKAGVPSQHDWRTSDEDEIARRRQRAQSEQLRVANLEAEYPIFSNFEVRSGSGLNYQVEIRSLSQCRYSCTCVDFRINGLGTCKHVEAVLLYLQARHRRLFRDAQANGHGRIDIVPDLASGTLRLECEKDKIPPRLRIFFNAECLLRDDDPESALAQLQKMSIPGLRISQDVQPWLLIRRRQEERTMASRDYEQKVQSGEWPAQETLAPLYPYQREGMLHLSFRERTLLADEMGLGKTIQAIAACALLHRLGNAARVLVVTPASLKTEWEDQIQRFTTLPYQLVFGQRRRRLKLYASAPFFTVANYEQMLADSLDVNELLRPDVVILDEAQRIKNWSTKTAQAVKRLQSRYAFVLTGTPIENRIDELHSIMAFLDPSALGPLFRFNREFYQLDERGRPMGYKNLGRLHARIKPFMLRRRKADVETELPDRTDRNFFVSLSDGQQTAYHGHEAEVARLMNIAKRRPLTQQESDKLLRELNMMRMICDTNYILDPEDRACPKLDELGKLLEECRDNPDVKVLVFSEWARMLELVRELCKRLKIGYAWHTGSVPQRRRRGEILMFKNNPDCRVFLSTDSGSTGLNLQNASVVINCDLPWNPARLEQRIARAWRKHQAKPVTVINLVSEGTIENRMLETLSVKQALADGVLDLHGDLDKIAFRGGRQAFVSRLEQLMAASKPAAGAPALKAPLPVDRSLAFSKAVAQRLGKSLVRCEERYPSEGPHSVLVVIVERDAASWQQALASLHEEFFQKNGSDPLAPPRLQVLDRSTDEAIQEMMAAGLVATATRAIRALYPSAPSQQASLSEEEKRKIQDLRQHAGRKLKMARVLADGDMGEEAREALLQSALSVAQARSVETRAPSPSSLADTLIAPASLLWGDFLPIVLEFAEGATDVQPVLTALQDSLSRPGEAVGAM